MVILIKVMCQSSFRHNCKCFIISILCRYFWYCKLIASPYIDLLMIFLPFSICFYFVPIKKLFSQLNSLLILVFFDTFTVLIKFFLNFINVFIIFFSFFNVLFTNYHIILWDFFHFLINGAGNFFSFFRIYFFKTSV